MKNNKIIPSIILIIIIIIGSIIIYNYATPIESGHIGINKIHSESIHDSSIHLIGIEENIILPEVIVMADKIPIAHH